jgi:hypothetical protein
MPFPWFRFYHEFATDPKVQSMPPTWQWGLLMIFCFHAAGTLKTFDDEVLASTLKVSADELAEIKACFVRRGFIGKDWTPKNWDKRQRDTDSSAARTKAYRDRIKNASTTSCDSHVTVTVTENPLNLLSYSSKDSSGEFTPIEEEEIKTESVTVTRPSQNGHTETNPAECPPYPDPAKSFVTIDGGPEELPDEVARDLWRRIFARWHDETLCADWYQHQRWYTAEIWTAAFSQVEKKYPKQKIRIGLVETIAASYAANGKPVALPPAALPTRPKSKAAERREANEARLAELRARPGYQTTAEMIEEDEREQANKKSGKQ